jgi:hypothetical protein
MERLKKALRLLCLVILLTFAAMGMGLTGNMFPNTRERYMDKEIRTEQVDKKEEEDEDSEEVRS